VIFQHAIVRAPGPNFADGLSTAKLGAPVLERALEQHEAYCRALQACGLSVIRLEPDPRHPDAPFVEDAAVVTAGCAILARPGAPERRGEVPAIRAALAGLYPSVSAIEPPGTVDGGDVCQAEDHFFIGVSHRTNEEGALQLARRLHREGFTTAGIDIRPLARLLHLKSGLAYLGDRRLAVTDELAGHPELAGYDAVRVEAAERDAANCVRINHRVLVAAGHPGFETALRALGYAPLALEMSEFQKMDGGLSCLSLRF
jgi:dimethylargininase